MNAGTATGASAEASTLLQRLPLYMLIACLPFCDFVQNGMVAFNALPVMGDIGSSPEEYSLIATLYACVAIALIACHRWLIERIGWRRFVQGSCVLFAAGALLCASSAGIVRFAVGRILMAGGSASFMTAGRVLVNRIPPSPRRFTGIKFFASGIAWGATIGPLLASAAWVSQGWRAGFAALLLPAALIAALASSTLPGREPDTAPSSRSHPLGLLALMSGSFVLLYALQRSSFEFFNDPLGILFRVAAALPALGIFVALDRRRANPLIRFADLAQRRFGVGLAVFGIAYVALGANSYMLPMLLQRALDLPLDAIGRYLGLGALAGVAAWIVMARLLARAAGPTRYYIAAFGALLCCGVLLASMSESAHPMQRVVPALLCNGAFVIVVLSTTAMQTFQGLQRDDTIFSHANQVKNMLAQFSLAVGVALATLCMQWRSSLHYARLGERLVETDPAVQDALARLTQYVASTSDAVQAPRIALAQLAAWVAREATLMAALDYFVAVAAFAAVCLVLVLAERVTRMQPSILLEQRA